MAATLSPRKGFESDQRIVIPKVEWERYVAIADALPDRRDLRIIFVDGRVLLLGISRLHDWFVEVLGQLVVVVANRLGLVWEQAGQATFRRRDLAVGVEGDKTFYFGPNAERMRGPLNIDLVTQPPPDLAIEVEVSHPADAAMIAYGRLGVPEVWRYDVERETLGFWRRRDDGTYEPMDRSVVLAPLEPNDVLEQLRRADALGSSGWFAQLDDWARDVLLPRRVDPA